MKFLLALRSGIEIIEAETVYEAADKIADLKYPANFVSLTVMEYQDGPY